jgi:hypothetical protein
VLSVIAEEANIFATQKEGQMYNPEGNSKMSSSRFIFCLIVLFAVFAPSIYFGWRIWQTGAFQ